MFRGDFQLLVSNLGNLWFWGSYVCVLLGMVGSLGSAGCRQGAQESGELQSNCPP